MNKKERHALKKNEIQTLYTNLLLSLSIVEQYTRNILKPRYIIIILIKHINVQWFPCYTNKSLVLSYISPPFEIELTPSHKLFHTLSHTFIKFGPNWQFVIYCLTATFNNLHVANKLNEDETSNWFHGFLFPTISVLYGMIIFFGYIYLVLLHSSWLYD